MTAHSEDLARRYRAGASLDDLGILCGCSSGRVRTILLAHGVAIRPRGYNPDGAKPNRFVDR